MSPRGRDFRAELAGEPCWDQSTEALLRQRGEPLQDRILQNREELLALCRFIEARGVRSYLEIGVWTGRLCSALHRLFSFDTVAACDDGYARRFGLPLALPAEIRFFEGDSTSAAFLRWRAELGPVDLVFIDGDHTYRGVRRDFELQRRFPHRFLALHDISGANRYTRGVGRFWQELAGAGGARRVILCPHRELDLDHSVMGIGLWSASEPL